MATKPRLKMPVREADRSLSAMASAEGGVRIEVDHRVEAPATGLVDERPFDRRADLDDVVLEEPPLEVRDAQVLRPDHTVEGLLGRIEAEAGGGLVGDQGDQLPLRMEAAQRLVEHAGPVQVGEGEAGIAEDLHGFLSSRSTVSELNARS
jgi:hypothetical protein